MSIEQAIELLRAHNIWRRGGEGAMVNPTDLGIAIDTVCDHFRNTTKKVLTWQDIKRIVHIADELIKEPEFCKTEEQYYTEILKRYKQWQRKS